MEVWLDTQTRPGVATGRGPWYRTTPVQETTKALARKCTRARSVRFRRVPCKIERKILTGEGVRIRVEARRGWRQRKIGKREKMAIFAMRVLSKTHREEDSSEGESNEEQQKS